MIHLNFAGEQQSVVRRVRVIPLSEADGRESFLLIESAGRRIGGPDLERRGARAETQGPRQRGLQQCPPDPLPPPLLGHSQIVYLQFIEDYFAGEGAEETDGTGRAYRTDGRQGY